MDKRIQELLSLINHNGYECYIVGGYVRDYLLGINSSDYDLCTNAKPSDLVTILSNYKIIRQSFGMICLLIDDLKVEISTYRREIKYYKRKPIQYQFINSLKEDLKRRDFTINTLCMDEHGKVIDYLSGIADIKARVIRMVGDIDTKLKEDPLRILRALRFSVILDFQIESNLAKKIKDYGYLLKTLSYERKKDELNKFITVKRLDILKDFHLDDALELDLSKVCYYSDSSLIWFLIDKKGCYHLTKKERLLRQQVAELFTKGIDDYNIYSYGLEVSNLVGLLNNVDVTSKYNNLVIKKRKDIDIKSDDLIKLFNKEHLEHVYQLLEERIINHKLINEHDRIMSYLEEIKHTIY